MRKQNKTLVYGNYNLLDKDNPYVYAYTREDEQKKFLILLNFSSIIATADIEIDLSKTAVVLSNYKDRHRSTGTRIELQPYEALIYEL